MKSYVSNAKNKISKIKPTLRMWAGSETWKANRSIIYCGMPDYSLLWCQENFLALLNFQENTSQEPCHLR